MARPGSGIPGASKAECWSLGRARRVSGSSRSAFCVGRRQPGGVLPAGPVRSPDRHRRCGGPGPSPTRTPGADWSDRLRSWTGRSSRSCWPSGRRGVGTTKTSTKRAPHCTAVPARRCGCDRPSPAATGRSAGSTTSRCCCPAGSADRAADHAASGLPVIGKMCRRGADVHRLRRPLFVLFATTATATAPSPGKQKPPRPASAQVSGGTDELPRLDLNQEPCD